MMEIWYKFKHRYFPYVVALLGKYLLKLIAATCKFHVTGQNAFIQEAKKGALIVSLWHNRLPMIAPILLKVAPEFRYAAFVSDSRDGELIATIVKSYPQARAIRVPKRSKSYALKKTIQYLQNESGILLITPDGPRGPKYEVKPGILLASLETNTPIIQLNWTANRYWRLKTWDHMMIPKPFSTISVTLGQPITLNGLSMEQAANSLSKNLNYL